MKAPVLVMGRRALRWIEKLRASVHVLTKIAHEPEASRVPCFVQYAADRANTHTMKAAAYFYPDRDPDRDLVEPATMEAATAYLKKIGYPGEAARIRTIYKELAKAIREITLRLFHPCYEKLGDDLPHQVSLVLDRAMKLELSLLEAELAVLSNAQAAISKLAAKNHPRAKGQGDKKKGQKKRRPLNDRVTACLAEFNRKRDQGKPVTMAGHCREFCEEAGDCESVYRTLKDYSDLWHKPAKKGTKQGTR